MKRTLLRNLVFTTVLASGVQCFAQAPDGDTPQQSSSGRLSGGQTMAYTPCPTLTAVSSQTNAVVCTVTNAAAASMTASNGNPGYFYTWFNNVNQAANQNSTALPGFGSNYSAAQTRGLWFVCPTNTVLTGVRVPTDIGTANQFVYILKLAAIPPEFTGSTTGYTVLGKYLDVPGTGTINCGIPLTSGDIIGVLGVRGSTATTNASSSYGTPSGTFMTSIGGSTTALVRFIFQSNIATTPLGAVSSASTGALGRVELYFGSSISNTSTASNLQPGNYSCYYTDIDGCMNSSTLAIAASGVSITGVSSVTNAVCGSNGLASYSPTTGTGPFSYSWTPAGGNNSVTASLNAPGVYSVLVTDASGNCATNTVVITDNVVIPTLTVSGTTAQICAGQTVSLQAAGTSTDYTWNGSVIGSTYTDVPTSNTSYTVLAGAGTCTTDAVIPVALNPLPVVIAFPSSTNVCAGESVSLTATGASAYSWNTTQTGSMITVNPASNTTYTVTGTDANNCSADGTVAVSTMSLPVITGVSSNSVMCAGETVTLTFSGASSFTLNGVPSASSVAVSPASNANYTISGSDGTCTNSLIFNQGVNALPVVAITGATTICAGESTTFSATGASSYSWGSAGSGQQITVTPSAATNYTVTGVDVNNCANSATVALTVDACTGINLNNAATVRVRVFPNPAAGQVTVITASESTAEIISMLGSVVLRQLLPEGQNSIDVSSLASGIYYMRISAAGHEEVIQVIRQ